MTEKHGCSFIGDIGVDGNSCCREHDRAYAKGEFIAKFVADFVLFVCLIKTTRKGSNIGITIFNYVLRFFLATLMFLVVFTIGWIWWLKYLFRRWFGWFAKKED